MSLQRKMIGLTESFWSNTWKYMYISLLWFKRLFVCFPLFPLDKHAFKTEPSGLVAFKPHDICSRRSNYFIKNMHIAYGVCLSIGPIYYCWYTKCSHTVLFNFIKDQWDWKHIVLVQMKRKFLSVFSKCWVPENPQKKAKICLSIWNH